MFFLILDMTSFEIHALILKRNVDFRRVTNAIELRKAIWPDRCEVAPIQSVKVTETIPRRISSDIRGICLILIIVIGFFQTGFFLWCWNLNQLLSVYKLMYIVFYVYWYSLCIYRGIIANNCSVSMYFLQWE